MRNFKYAAAVLVAWLVCGGLSAQEFLTLQKCKELALKNNEKIRTSQLAVESAKESRSEAFTKYFPQVSAMAVGFRSTAPMMQSEIPIGTILGNPAMPPLEIEMLKKGSIGLLSASQPLFAGGQIVNGNKLAKLGVEVAEIQQKMSSDEVSLTVEQYFWQIRMLEEKMKTVDESEKLLNRAHQDVSNSLKAGLVNKSDLLQVELRQNELQSGKLKLSNGLALSRLVLAQFIGLEGQEIHIQATVEDSLQAELPVDHKAALAQRAEYRLLEKSVEAEKLQTKMEIGKNLPTVALGAGWNAMSFDKGSSSAMSQNFGMGFATVSIPITSWWGGSHAIKKQKIQVRKAENAQKNNAELLVIQMQQLWNEVTEAEALVRLSLKTIHAAEENLRLTSDYYRAGTGPVTDMLDAQRALQDAEDQHTEAFATCQLKRSRYKQATGNY